MECGRLQGAPDGWTELEPPLSNSARYRQYGNAGAVPVVFWIGLRIAAAEAGLLDDVDFESVCEAAASGDVLARHVVQDWIEQTLGTTCRRD